MVWLLSIVPEMKTIPWNNVPWNYHKSWANSREISALSLAPVSFTSNQSLQQIHPTDSHLHSSTSFYCHGHHHNSEQPTSVSFMIAKVHHQFPSNQFHTLQPKYSFIQKKMQLIPAVPLYRVLSWLPILFRKVSELLLRFYKVLMGSTYLSTTSITHVQP